MATLDLATELRSGPLILFPERMGVKLSAGSGVPNQEATDC